MDLLTWYLTNICLWGWSMESGAKDLEGVLAEFSKRVSRLPADLQRIFCEDLATAAENRLSVLEKYGLQSS